MRSYEQVDYRANVNKDYKSSELENTDSYFILFVFLVIGILVLLSNLIYKKISVISFNNINYCRFDLIGNYNTFGWIFAKPKEVKKVEIIKQKIKFIIVHFKDININQVFRWRKDWFRKNLNFSCVNLKTNHPSKTCILGNDLVAIIKKDNDNLKFLAEYQI